MKACEDFLENVLYGHVLAAAKVSSDEGCSVNDVAGKIVSNFVKVTTPCFSEDDSFESSDCVEDADSTIEETDATAEDPDATVDAERDTVHTYAVDFLTMSLLWYGFRDAIREGDGDRIVRYWKFLIVVFKSENHYNYANEGFNFLCRLCYCLLEKLVSLNGLEL